MSVEVAAFLPVKVLAAVTATPGRGLLPAVTRPAMSQAEAGGAAIAGGVPCATHTATLASARQTAAAVPGQARIVGKLMRVSVVSGARTPNRQLPLLLRRRSFETHRARPHHAHAL